MVQDMLYRDTRCQCGGVLSLLSPVSFWLGRSGSAAMEASLLIDGVGQVSGTWVGRVCQALRLKLSMVISIMVDDAAAMVESIVRHGGKIIQPIGAHCTRGNNGEGFSDPVGNIWGIYQEPR